MKETPAVLGRRKRSNKMAADKSSQNIGGDAVTPRTSSPSTPAMNTGRRNGESAAETFPGALPQALTFRAFGAWVISLNSV